MEDGNLRQRFSSVLCLSGEVRYSLSRLQNSPYFCVFKYARVVKQKVWNKAETCEVCALRARKNLSPRFTDFFTDFQKKTDCFAVYSLSEFNSSKNRQPKTNQRS